MGRQTCGHFDAEATGTVEARELRDGRWEYSTAYRCPDCGTRFVEKHVGGLGLGARIDAALTEVQRLEAELVSQGSATRSGAPRRATKAREGR